MSIKYHLQILGCAANEADGERIAGFLDGMGFEAAENAGSANLIVAVACSVRQSAMDRIYHLGGQWKKRRQKGEVKTILTGCVLGTDKNKLAEVFDWITPIASLPRWGEKLAEWFGDGPGGDNGALSGGEADSCGYLDLPARHTTDYSAYVPIMNGCNNFCAYCAVPYTRGREVSRGAEQIVNEVEQIVEQGGREITLLGQNVNSYRDKGVGVNFPELLRRLQALKGDFWLRFMTSHPKDLSDELLEVIEKSDKLCEHLHLAAQSGSNCILGAMNRNYTRERYLGLVEGFRGAIERGRTGERKLSAVTTDIIVGFPGEAEADFEQTADLMRTVRFDMAYIARYSPRAGTAAAKMPDDVPVTEKKRRDTALNDILRETALENNLKYVGATIEGLVMKAHGQREVLARTRTAKNVVLTGGADLIGKIVSIKITQAGAWGLRGELAG